MRGRDKHHAEQLGAMLWAARIKCRAAQGTRTHLDNSSLTTKIVEGAKMAGITMRKTNGKILL